MRLTPAHFAPLAYLLAFLTALGPLSVDGVVPAFPATGEALHVPIASVHWVLSVFIAGLALGQLVWGPIADRFGRRPTQLAGLVLFLGATAICLIATELVMLLVGRFVQAIAASAGMVASRAVPRDWFEGERAVQFFSIITGALFLAPAVAPVMGGYATQALGWRGMYLLLAAWSFIGLILVAALLPETRPAGERSGKSILGSAGAVFGERQFTICALVTGLASAGMFAFIAASAQVLMVRFRLSPVSFGHVYLLVALGFVVGARLNRISAGASIGTRLRWGLLPGAIAGAALAAVDLAGPSGSSALIGMIGCAFLFYLSLGLTQPIAMASSLAPFRDLTGAASSWLGFVQMGMSAVASMLIGGLEAASEIAVALTFLGTALLAMLATGFLARDSPRA